MRMMDTISNGVYPVSNKGGLPAIPKYDIERHWYLHELRRVRALARVWGSMKGLEKPKREYQIELCKLRRDRNV